MGLQIREAFFREESLMGGACLADGVGRNAALYVIVALEYLRFKGVLPGLAGLQIRQKFGVEIRILTFEIPLAAKQRRPVM